MKFPILNLILYIILSAHASYGGRPCLLFSSVSSNSSKIYKTFIENSLINLSKVIKTDKKLNGTNSDQRSSEFKSAKGCPGPVNGFPWVNFGQPPSCSLAGEQGPCPDGEKILPQVDSEFGVCGCRCLADDSSRLEFLKNSDRFLFCKLNSSEEHPYEQVQMYDKQQKKCYKPLQLDRCCENQEVIFQEPKNMSACFPICEHVAADWIGLLVDLSLCAREFNASSATPLSQTVQYPSVVSSILPGKPDCGKDKKYSETLKECVGGGRRTV